MWTGSDSGRYRHRTNGATALTGSLAPSIPLPEAVVPAARGGRIRSTLRRLGAHLVNTASDAVGDDIGGRALRRAAVRRAGATVPRSTHLLGGTFFSRPLHLRTGERCLINRNCYLDLHAGITLGDDVVVGHGTSIVTSRHELGSTGRRAGMVVGDPVAIGSGAWLGANVTILPGVTVGPGAVVAAGAVVTADVPANTLVAGVPARQIRRLDLRAV